MHVSTRAFVCLVLLIGVLFLVGLVGCGDSREGPGTASTGTIASPDAEAVTFTSGAISLDDTAAIPA